MNTVICYLTALVMQFAAMNTACETNSVSILPSQQCEKQTIIKTDIFPSKTEELSPIYFREEQKQKEKNEQS